MKVFIKNKGQINLSKNNFLAAGGEGEIYVNGGLAFKIYTDSKKMIPLGKIDDLSHITDNNIIKPEDILLDTKNIPIGYTMKYVSDTHSLCQIFTKAFRDRNSITPQIMLDLVRKLQELVQHVHEKKILIVDLNELNFLVSKDFKTIFGIDCDSYQTPHYPATAIMDSIRDRHSQLNKFNEGTDWFSFGIISCQMFLGINPFKGSHPTIKSLDDRMLQNISVFNKSVSVPNVCYPFDVIPEVYRNWYRAVFDDGKRVAPPTDLHAVAQVIAATIKNIVGSNNFDIHELGSYIGDIIDVFWNTKTVLTTDQCTVGKVIIKDIPTSAKFVTLPRNNNIIAAWISGCKLQLKNIINQQNIPLDLDVRDLMMYDNRLYVKIDTSVLEIKFIETGVKVLASTNIVANVLEYASKVYHGVIIQNLLGAYYVSLFPKSGEHHQIRLKELDTYKIVDARCDVNILMVVGFKNGKYDKLIFKFDETDSYDLRVENDITYLDLNFVVSDRGICVHFTENDELEVFSVKQGSNTIKRIKDNAVSSDFKLFRDGGTILAAKNNKLYSIKMR